MEEEGKPFFQELHGKDWLLGRMAEVISESKRALDGLALDLGRMVAEAVMYLEREEVSGPDYRPYRSEVRKWASQPGSVYIGDRKVKVKHPRLRGVEGEMELRTYGKMKERGGVFGGAFGASAERIGRAQIPADGCGSG